MRRPDSLPRWPSRADESEGLLWRLLAALVAVPVFEASLFLGLYLVYPSRGMAWLFMSIPLWVHAVYAGTAFAAGLLSGFKGITWLLGHLFFTHHENEKSVGVTTALWAALVGLLFLASHFVP